MWMKDWDQTVERNYYFWVIRNSSTTIIVDAGVSPEIAKQRGLNNYISPQEALKTIDIDAKSVKHVILTHIHWDHAGGIGLFPNATVYVQNQEYKFWMKDSIARSSAFSFFWDDVLPAELESIETSGRLKLIDGDRHINSGVECLLAPGHSVALQAVAVNTPQGTAVIGSDCGHFFANYKQEWPSSLIVDLPGWISSFQKLRAKVSSAELLFPGHDPLMSKNYPEIAEGITKLV
ncbi:MAG: N-acyl homoserine lactonase family protein [Desulfobacterales bacterium]|nr:N-acyl homoserine lactonase family protein [Deltaproteobacteria bacterium]NNK95872.1 N-acyl homoserine lactonase family protein [Desulfobacterales bacterium]